MTTNPLTVGKPHVSVGTIRRLVVGLWSRQYDLVYSRAGSLHDLAIMAEAYTDAAHVALPALGATSVPPAPFGLMLIVREAVRAAGPRPPATDSTALPVWREQLTDAIVAKITEAAS